jgi:MFS family permease
MSMALQQRLARRNFLALIGDFVFFMIGFAFYDPYTVVPVFVERFTGSAILVGLLASVRALTVALPQVLAAGVLAARPRKTPVLIASSVGGRLPLLFLALATLLWVDEHPLLVVVLLGLAVAVFFTSEGLNGVTWPALIAKVIPEGVRGRFFGLGQFLSGLCAMGAGYAVRVILGAGGLALSARWALLFGCAFVATMLSVACMSFVREREGEVESTRVDLRRSVRTMLAHLRDDGRLRRLVATHFVLGIGSAAFSFFAVRAQELLPDGEAMVGTFVMLQNAGSIGGALLCGQLVDRLGSWSVIRLVAALQIVALSLVAAAASLSSPLLAYWPAFLLLGLVTGSAWWTFTNYLLDLADDEQRPTYLAASGLLLSPTFLSSVLVGGVFQAALPEVVFAALAVVSAIGLGLAWGLPKLRPGTGSP